ncbi:MAG: class 1 fructose-bisphosphatase [Candidatus Altiarchaeota archaeon]
MHGEVKLEDFLSENCDDEELGKLILDFSNLSIHVSNEFPHRLGDAGTKNIYGEDQKALDVWTNDFLMEELFKTGVVKTVASEELDGPVDSEDGTGSFVVTMDPLDGSSNVKSNNLFGTIVGIYKDVKLPVEGRKQVAALYKLYGPLTSLVLTFDGKVYEFVKCSKCHQNFMLLHEDMKMPEAKIYGVGGNPDKWIPEFEFFVRLLRSEGLKLRYGGSFVGDFNQILHHGGFFGYPSFMNKPSGKLRLVFEGSPMALIAENAGGKSSNGSQSLLDVKPKKLDQRTPIYIGNDELIDNLEEIFKTAKDAREEF